MARATQCSPIRKSRPVMAGPHPKPVVPSATSPASSLTSSMSLGTSPVSVSGPGHHSLSTSGSTSGFTSVSPSPSTSNSRSASFSNTTSNRRGSSGQRRSSFLAECMLKEKVLMQRYVGRDGVPTFSLRLTEAQGFKWSQSVFDMAISDDEGDDSDSLLD